MNGFHDRNRQQHLGFTNMAAAGTIVVRSEKELANAAVESPASRLVDLWNRFAGVAPFTAALAYSRARNLSVAVGFRSATQRAPARTVAVVSPSPTRFSSATRAIKASISLAAGERPVRRRPESIVFLSDRLAMLSEQSLRP